jgi:hypothetical protein
MRPQGLIRRTQYAGSWHGDLLAAVAAVAGDETRMGRDDWAMAVGLATDTRTTEVTDGPRVEFLVGSYNSCGVLC